MQDGSMFAFAGLWEGSPGQESFTILTTEANDFLSPLHHRMPVIIEPANYDRWLDPKTTVDETQALPRPYPSDRLVAHPVSARVNSAAHDDPKCVTPRKPDQLLF
jgi:putative SOS response-associated peptidase YedK